MYQKLYDFNVKTKRISASSLRSLVIIYDVSQVSSLLIKAMIYYECNE